MATLPASQAGFQVAGACSQRYIQRLLPIPELLHKTTHPGFRILMKRSRRFLLDIDSMLYLEYGADAIGRQRQRGEVFHSLRTL